MPSNPDRDQQIDSLSRSLLKSEPYLMKLGNDNPRKALKAAVRAAVNLLDGKPHGLPPV